MRKHDQLNDRTKAFAVRAVALAKQLDSSAPLASVALQLSRAATSAAANQRAARRARSMRELAAKLSIVVEEADEALFWCEILQSAELPAQLSSSVDWLFNEASQLRAMYAKGRATVRQKLTSP